jgi:hypothetical protein
MHEDGTVGIFDWRLNVRELYDDMLDNYPDVQISEDNFRDLVKHAMAEHYEDDDLVPAMLLLAGLIRLYQGKT